MPVTNDEQTCSLFALAVYTYLDPIIFLGARVSHLGFNQLPPLSDTDYSKNLTEEAFPVSIHSTQPTAMTYTASISISIHLWVPNALGCYSVCSGYFVSNVSFTAFWSIVYVC